MHTQDTLEKDPSNMSTQSAEKLPTKNELLGLLKSLTPEQLQEVDRLLFNLSEPWLPNPGPQSVAARSRATEIFFGGAAGGGKTDFLIGHAASAHYKSLILRREHKQTKSVEDRLIEMLVTTGHGRYVKSPDSIFISDNRGGYKIELGGVKDIGSELKYQGRPHDLKGFDELCQFPQSMFTYINIWRRSTDPRVQLCQSIGAGNPPTDEDGMWVIDYWAPWIDPNYLGKRAAHGELRYFITITEGPQAGKYFEVEAAERVKFKGKEYEPVSRTFIGSSLDDNPFYAGSSYASALAMLPEPLRSKFLGGDFSSGIQEDPYQLIPRHWVELAQKRWRERTKPNIPMTQLGADATRGGNDRFILSPRYGTYFDHQIVLPGPLTKDGPTAAVEVAKHMTHSVTKCALDIIGIGSSVGDALARIKPGKVLFMNASEGADGQTDRSGLLTFRNQRAWWYWMFREALDPVEGMGLAIPDDPEILRELCAIRYQPLRSGIQIESKDDIKSRLGRSPDKADSLIYAWNVPATPGIGFAGYIAEQAGLALEEAEARKAASSDDHLVKQIRIGT